MMAIDTLRTKLFDAEAGNTKAKNLLQRPLKHPFSSSDNGNKRSSSRPPCADIDNGSITALPISQP